MKDSIQVVQTKVVRFNTVSGGFIVRETRIKNGFARLQIPSRYATPAKLLERFYRYNPSASTLGFKYLKRKWPDNNIAIFAFCDRYALFVEQDRDEGQHFVSLRFQSPVNQTWYWIATSRDSIECANFFDSPTLQKQLRMLIFKRRFRQSAAMAETDQEIPME